MAEVLVQFDSPVTDENDRAYVVRICGGVAEDGLWQAWVEFDPEDGGPTLRTPRETEQPNRRDLEYWATGLTASYLEGALDRARRPETPDLRPRTVAASPTYDRPAPSAPASASTPDPRRSHGLLDPFEVYRQGEDVLSEELGALNAGHLRTIAREHSLVKEEGMDLDALDRVALAEMIVAAVRKRMA